MKRDTNSEGLMLLGGARAKEEFGRWIEKAERRVPDGQRIRDEGAANSHRARVEAFGGKYQIMRESEERPQIPWISN
jgi:hypothetical protein